MNNADTMFQTAFDSTWGSASTAITKIGILNPEQADRFIDYVFDQSVLTHVARIVRMNTPSQRIPRVGMGDKVLVPATRGVDPGITAQANVAEITLNTKEVIAEVQILDDELEDNVERGAWMDHLMRILGTKVGNQLELAYLMGQQIPNGGPTAKDINQLFFGWKYQVEQNGGHVVDGASSIFPDRYLSTQKLSKLIKAIPTKYRTRQMDLRFLISANIYQDFIDLVGNRATPFGDQAYRSAGYEQNLPPMGANSVLGWGSTPLWTVPLLPENLFVVKPSAPATATVASGGAAGASTAVLSGASTFANGDGVNFGSGATAESKTILSGGGTTTLTVDSPFVYARTVGDAVTNGTLDGTFIMCTHFLNHIFGIQRDIRIELERRARERATYAVVTMRTDCTTENPDAASIMPHIAVH